MAGAGGTGGTGGSGAGIHTVFVILMENHNWSSIAGSSSAPYINNTLLPMSSYATGYRGGNHGQLHPSEPNYVWLEAGTNSLPNGSATYTFTGDADPSAGNQSTTTTHLVTQLNTAGISWKSYQENLPANSCGTTSSGLYAAKHNPMVFFSDVTSNSTYCRAHVVPMTQLATDLQSASTTPRYSFITPNLCNDMHGATGCPANSIQTGDTWLSQNVPMILASPAYQQGGALIITWDESETSSTTCAPNCPPIGMIVLSPHAKGAGYHNTIAYDHSSTVKTIQEIFGVTPLLGNASGATDLADLFTTFP
jgi:phospholipase C